LNADFTNGIELVAFMAVAVLRMTVTMSFD
jgi:hypothetical protein